MGFYALKIQLKQKLKTQGYNKHTIGLYNEAQTVNVALNARLTNLLFDLYPVEMTVVAMQISNKSLIM